MNVLVTGGAGFLGSHLVDALVERGYQVTVLDNLHRGRMENLARHVSGKGKIKFVRADIRDYPAVQEVVVGMDLVYHLAAQSNVMGAMQDIEYSFTTNVAGTLNVVRSASACGVRRVVFASSREVYGEPMELPVKEESPLLPKNPYGASKVAAETYCRVWHAAEGLDCLVLRFANIYGPRDEDRVIPLWLKRARTGQDLEVYGGKQVLDFVWVGYAVDALLAAADCSNDGAINVGSGQGIALTDLAARILEVTRSSSKARFLAAREPEVVRFVADVRRMQSILCVAVPEDALQELNTLAAG